MEVGCAARGTWSGQLLQLTFNDASIAYLKSAGVQEYVYPLENDLENLKLYAHKDGIVPVYFHPSLFYARMPVKGASKSLSDADKNNYRIKIVDHMTNVYPEIPVCLTQFRKQLDNMGFYKYLIDVSNVTPSKGILNKILQHLEQSKMLPQTNTFNFQRELL